MASWVQHAESPYATRTLVRLATAPESDADDVAKISM
jgi:hypothetical protein